MIHISLQSIKFRCTDYIMLNNGDSDVGDIVMLVTLWLWLIWDVCARIIMLAANLALFSYVSYFRNVLNRSPTSQICHQHIRSPTSVTNINVTSERGENEVKYHLVKVIWMDEDDTVNHYEANYQFIFTWSMIRLVVSTDLGSRSVMVCIGPNVTMSHGP